ncbi:MAG: DUF3019 domain-containing protein [Colwellia sp.]|nr:DUF3019 domain-containing protein [Colwellia sp.]MCW8866048.1 DUF3019 domain-containing protein [Colwellia sp.]MCW9081252.1 DUF3019 domain-containing protein [Colwellia sp.]
MYFSFSKGIALLILFNCFSALVNAEETTLSTAVTFNVQPQQCVTLRQGRNCFATISIQWQKQTETTLCLYQVNKQLPNSEKQLVCWSEKNKGQISVEFESSDNLTYQLRTLKDERLVAESEVVVSWVHENTTRRRRWRLF